MQILGVCSFAIVTVKSRHHGQEEVDLSLAGTPIEKLGRVLSRVSSVKVSRFITTQYTTLSPRRAMERDSFRKPLEVSMRGSVS